jgi:hypothetical protein
MKAKRSPCSTERSNCMYQVAALKHDKLVFRIVLFCIQWLVQDDNLSELPFRTVGIRTEGMLCDTGLISDRFRPDIGIAGRRRRPAIPISGRNWSEIKPTSQNIPTVRIPTIRKCSSDLRVRERWDFTRHNVLSLRVVLVLCLDHKSSTCRQHCVDPTAG